MKPRTPPACIICSKPDARKKYEAAGIGGRLFAGKAAKTDGLVLTKRISQYEFHCTNCGWSRPDPILEIDGVTKMWFVSCKKCGERHISPELDKCAHCDLGLI